MQTLDFCKPNDCSIFVFKARQVTVLALSSSDVIVLIGVTKCRHAGDAREGCSEKTEEAGEGDTNTSLHGGNGRESRELKISSVPTLLFVLRQYLF